MSQVMGDMQSVGMFGLWSNDPDHALEEDVLKDVVYANSTKTGTLECGGGGESGLRVKPVLLQVEGRRI